ncbi:MAG: hypothetical protein HY961_02855 [Ignavibacteriae bacterium]|nr:hypothetical protein [Ignavibacteriota bacterium]
MTVNANGYARTDKPAEVTLNFTALLGGGTLNDNSIRVIEVNNVGTVIDTSVVFQFDKDPAYNASTNAVGAVVFMLGGTTASSATRYFHIYFDEGLGFALPFFSNQLTLTDNVFFQGQFSYQIANQLGTLWYHKIGGGFAGMRDLNNVEWIGFNPTPGSHGAGEYRGIPNMGVCAHPGYSNGSSSIINQGPIKVTIKTQTTDGSNFTWYWAFYPTYQTMTLTSTGTNYWILYEGIPNGTVNTSTGFVKTSAGATISLGSNFAYDLPDPEWMYFGETGLNRFMYLAHHEGDSQIDHYRQFVDVGAMTIGAFGRDGGSVTRYMSGVPQHLTFGFGENESQSATIMDNAFRDLSVSTGGVESTTFSVGNIHVTPGVTSAIITWTTSRPGTTSLSYGTTTSYGATITDTNKVTMHGVTLTGLMASALYHYQIASVDTGGNPDSTSDQTFTTSGAFIVASIHTDHFNTTPFDSTLWTPINPLGDATLSVNGTQLSIAVPGGTSHDVWTNNNLAPRIMQTCNNVDFDVETKFDTPLNSQYQLEGMLVQQDTANFLRFNLQSDGSAIKALAVSFVGGVATMRFETSLGVNNIAPLYLRVTRVGNTWSLLHSMNGSTWTTAGSFSHTVTVSSIGVFAGNAGGNPALTCLVDYFKNRATVSLNATALLQGPYSAAGDSMRTDILPYLPLSQPYNVAPFNYTGAESIGAIPADVVDWVLIELRFAIDSASSVSRRAAFIKNNGSVVDLDGSSSVVFEGVPAGDYYIRLLHRNHIDIMSATPVTLSETSSLFDFSSSNAKAYGASSMVQVATGRFALCAGDANTSRIVTAADANILFGSLNQIGYLAGDVNLSGVVTAADANTLFANLNTSTHVP